MPPKKKTNQGKRVRGIPEGIVPSIEGGRRNLMTEPKYKLILTKDNE